MLGEEIEVCGTKNQTIGIRQVMTTFCVGRAWETCWVEQRDPVMRSLRNIRLAIPVDSNCDQNPWINGLTSERLKIGDWRILQLDNNTLLWWMGMKIHLLLIW